MPELLEKNRETIMGSLKEIKDMTQSQETKIDKIQNSLDLVNAS